MPLSTTDTDHREIKALYRQWAGEDPAVLEPLPQSGSYRRYYRINTHQSTVIGVYNADVRENQAFIELSRHFGRFDLPVPEVYAENDECTAYLINDFGDTTLYDELSKRRRHTGVFPGTTIEMYKEALAVLPRFQITAADTLNYDICYPRAAFDRQSMMWDLSYFKYYFLKLARVSFDEQALENDFQSLCTHLLQADDQYFMYRDFQSANIMVQDGQLHFIDYQGGRRGALQYDVASLLWDSKAAIPFEIKQLLLDHYLENASSVKSIDTGKFVAGYPGFVLIRLLQAMGAYGFRGFYERKTKFLQSIPYALKQLEHLLKHSVMPPEVPYLIEVLSRLQESPELARYSRQFDTAKPLSVEVQSFSYHGSMPQNRHGHGGGFVFDCRCIRNPGNYEKYAELNGKSPEVIEFLAEGKEAEAFLHEVFQLIDQAVEKYLSRSFSHLQICFGGTRGRYRPVFCAEQLCAYLAEKYGSQVRLDLIHRELQNPSV